MGVPYFKARLAHAAAQRGGKAEARRLFGEALDQVDVFGEGCWHAEILRLDALVQAGEPEPDLAAARAALGESLRIARGQGALAWQLRTLTTLCQLRPEDGELGGDLGGQLRATIQQFREGLELPDLKEARSVLRSCGGSTRLPRQQAVQD